MHHAVAEHISMERKSWLMYFGFQLPHRMLLAIALQQHTNTVLFGGCQSKNI